MDQTSIVISPSVEDYEDTFVTYEPSYISQVNNETKLIDQDVNKYQKKAFLPPPPDQLFISNMQKPIQDDIGGYLPSKISNNSIITQLFSFDQGNSTAELIDCLEIPKQQPKQHRSQSQKQFVFQSQRPVQQKTYNIRYKSVQRTCLKTTIKTNFPNILKKKLIRKQSKTKQAKRQSIQNFPLISNLPSQPKLLDYKQNKKKSIYNMNEIKFLDKNPRNADYERLQNTSQKLRKTLGIQLIPTFQSVRKVIEDCKQLYHVQKIYKNPCRSQRQSPPKISDFMQNKYQRYFLNQYYKMSLITPESSKLQRHHSKLSAERYSRISNEFEDLDALNPSSFRFEDLFPDMDYSSVPRHHRRKSQPSQQSQGNQQQSPDSYENKQRNDAVLKQILSALNQMQEGPKCKQVSQMGSFDFSLPTLHTRKISEVESVIMIESESTQNLNRFPELGTQPVMAYCRSCGVEVHTIVKIQGNSLVKFWGQVLNCCGSILWVEKKKVHKCPHCAQMIGYSKY